MYGASLAADCLRLRLRGYFGLRLVRVLAGLAFSITNNKQSSSFRLIFDACCFAASRGGWSEIRVGFACMGSVAVVVIL